MKYFMPATFMSTIDMQSFIRILINLYVPGSGFTPSTDNPIITLYSKSTLNNEERTSRYNAFVNHLIVYLSNKKEAKKISILGENIPTTCFKNLYDLIKANPCFKTNIDFGHPFEACLTTEQLQIRFDINELITTRQQDDKTAAPPISSPSVSVSWPSKHHSTPINAMTSFYLTGAPVISENCREMKTIITIDLLYQEKDSPTRIFRLSSFINHLLSYYQFNNRIYAEINIFEKNIPIEVFENLRQFIVEQASDFQTEIYLGPSNRELSSSQFQILQDINLEIIKRQARTNATNFYSKHSTEKSPTLNALYWFNSSLTYPKFNAIEYTKLETVIRHTQSKRKLSKFADEKSNPLGSTVSFDSCLITQTLTTQQIFYFKQEKLISSFPEYKTKSDTLTKKTLSLEDILNQDSSDSITLIWSPTEKIFTRLPNFKEFKSVTLQNHLIEIETEISGQQQKEEGINTEISILTSRLIVQENLSTVAEDPKIFSQLFPDTKEHQRKEGVLFHKEIMGPLILSLREELGQKQKELDLVRGTLEKLYSQQKSLSTEIHLLTTPQTIAPPTGTITGLLTSTVATFGTTTTRSTTHTPSTYVNSSMELG